MASGDQGWKRARKRRAYHHQLIKLLKNLQDLPVCIVHRKLLFKRQCFRLKSFALLPLMHFHGQRIGLRQKAKNLPLDIRFLKIGSLVIHMAPTNKKNCPTNFPYFLSKIHVVVQTNRPKNLPFFALRMLSFCVNLHGKYLSQGRGCRQDLCLITKTQSYEC